MGIRKFRTWIIWAALLFMLLSMTGCATTTAGTNGTLPPITVPTDTENAEPFISQAELALPETTQQPLVKMVGKLEARFIDVGQGDCIFVILPNGQTILIDAGDAQYGERIVSFIRGFDVKRIDYLVSSHPHADHIGGMSAIIDSFDIGEIFMPDITHTTNSFEALISSIENKNLSITIAEAGLVLCDFENLNAAFVAPISKTNDANNMSAVLRISYGDTAFLLTGDAERESESQMLSSGINLKADVLKVGHHGSSTSSTKAFIQAVAPKYAVISSGAGNQYGHPTEKTLHTLEGEGIEVFRTDEVGTITVISDGVAVTIDKNATEIQPNAPPVQTIAPKQSEKTPSAEKTTVPASSQKQSTEVFVTRTGERYHLGHCSSLRKSKIPTTLEKAKRDGYTPCGNCHPPK